MDYCDVELEEAGCPQCGAFEYTQLFSSEDRLHNLPGKFWVVKCIKCGLMRTNPRPTASTIGFYYPDDYGPYVTTSKSVSTGDQKNRPLWKRLLRSIMGDGSPLVHALPPELKVGNALEIGCASGSYLDVMSDLGWNVQGVEFSPAAGEIARSRGYSVYIGSLETAPNPEVQFNLIVGWMVLEHLHKPKECLKRLAQWASADARLVLSVPNCNSLLFKLCRGYEYGLQVPAHLTHFTPATLSALLEGAGWKVDRIIHQRTTSSIFGTIGFLLRDKFGLNNKLVNTLVNYDLTCGKIDYWLYPLKICLAALGQTGRMTIWAIKKQL